MIEVDIVIKVGIVIKLGIVIKGGIMIKGCFKNQETGWVIAVNRDKTHHKSGS